MENRTEVPFFGLKGFDSTLLVVQPVSRSLLRVFCYFFRRYLRIGRRKRSGWCGSTKRVGNGFEWMGREIWHRTRSVLCESTPASFLT